MLATDLLIAESGLPPVWFQETQSVVVILTSILIAGGTLALFFAAICGELLRNKYMPAKLQISLDSKRGHYIPNMGRYYYHVQIRNTGWTSARNCRVMLYGFSKRGPDHHYHPVPMPYAIQLTWTPSEMPPAYRCISRSKPETFDLGYIAKSGTSDRPPGFTPQAYGFTPQAYVMPRSYDDSLRVKANEARRYYVRVEADNALTNNLITVEVSWDGKWDSHSDTFGKHLVITEYKWKDPWPRK